MLQIKNVFVMSSLKDYLIAALVPAMMLVACEKVDNNPEEHVDDDCYVQLSEVAQVFASIPIQPCHLTEVHDAVCASSSNGYDEEYTMSLLFESPGAGVGDNIETRSATNYDHPLRELICEHLVSTKSTVGIPDTDRWLNELKQSDIQVYWPYSERWDGKSLPIITFDPEDDSDVNVGYRIIVDQNGNRNVEEIFVDEEMAKSSPVWVINRNSDAGYKTLELLRKEHPEWNEGGNLVIQPSSVPATKSTSKALILKNFKMRYNYDCWFAGGSEFFIKIGSVKDFTATTEAELKLYNPKVTDMMLVVTRSEEGVTIPLNTMLLSDWTDQMTHCAFMMIEDDGGTWTEWSCTALVRIASKSYGIEINLPIKSWDDIVWRGRLAWNWLEAYSGKTSRFGGVDLTFEVQDY